VSNDQNASHIRVCCPKTTRYVGNRGNLLYMRALKNTPANIDPDAKTSNKPHIASLVGFRTSCAAQYETRCGKFSLSISGPDRTTKRIS
jgi:hypothetical protein